MLSVEVAFSRKSYIPHPERAYLQLCPSQLIKLGLKHQDHYHVWSARCSGWRHGALGGAVLLILRWYFPNICLLVQLQTNTGRLQWPGYDYCAFWRQISLDPPPAGLLYRCLLQNDAVWLIEQLCYEVANKHRCRRIMHMVRSQEDAALPPPWGQTAKQVSPCIHPSILLWLLLAYSAEYTYTASSLV